MKSVASTPLRFVGMVVAINAALITAVLSLVAIISSKYLQAVAHRFDSLLHTRRFSSTIHHVDRAGILGLLVTAAVVAGIILCLRAPRTAALTFLGSAIVGVIITPFVVAVPRYSSSTRQGSSSSAARRTRPSSRSALPRPSDHQLPSYRPPSPLRPRSRSQGATPGSRVAAARVTPVGHPVPLSNPTLPSRSSGSSGLLTPPSMLLSKLNAAFKHLSRSRVNLSQPFRVRTWTIRRA